MDNQSKIERAGSGAGGKRAGAGAKPKHGERMQQRSVRMPAAWWAALDDQCGEGETASDLIRAWALRRLRKKQ